MIDCVYFYRNNLNPSETYCLHNAKKYHLDQQPCPLYHIDWQKKILQTELITKLMRNKDK